MLRIYPHEEDIDIQKLEQTLQITHGGPNIVSISQPEDLTEGPYCVIFSYEEEPKDFDERVDKQGEAIQRAITWLKNTSAEQINEVRGTLGLKLDMLLSLGVFHLSIPLELIQELNRLKIEVLVMHICPK
jgi:hypothetical protein